MLSSLILKFSYFICKVSISNIHIHLLYSVRLSVTLKGNQKVFSDEFYKHLLSIRP